MLYDTTPLPDSVPQVKEIGTTSAPLLSASFFIGARCRPYNDDYMQCKTENPGKGEFECLKEGRRVTRCASSVYVHHHALHPSMLPQPPAEEPFRPSSLVELRARTCAEQGRTYTTGIAKTDLIHAPVGLTTSTNTA